MPFDANDPLRGIPLFADLSDDQRLELRDELIIFRPEPNSTIVKEGDVGDVFYVVIQGSVRIFKHIPGKVDENQMLIGIRKRGEMVGEMALIEDRQPRAASIIADPDCVLAEFEKDHFVRLVQRHPAIFLRVLETFSYRLRAAGEIHASKLSKTIGELNKEVDQRDEKIRFLRNKLKEANRYISELRRQK